MKPRRAPMKRTELKRGKPPERKIEMPRTEWKRSGSGFQSDGGNASPVNGPVKARRPADTGPPKTIKDLVKARAARDAEDGVGLCEVCGKKPGTNIHHRQPRGAGGCPLPYINLPSNLLLVCGHGNAIPGCHSRIENDREYAKSVGWLVSRPGLPVERRVLRRGVWVLLADDGSVEPVESEGAGLSGVAEGNGAA